MTTAQLKLKTNNKGFTLIELLVVIGILAVLLAITLIAINPQRQFAQANNTKRSSDVNAILNALGQYAADNKGLLPTSLPASGSAMIGSGATDANLCAELVPQYLAALPVDPQTNGGDPVDETECAGTYNTNYRVERTSNNRITITAPGAELGQTISVTR